MKSYRTEWKYRINQIAAEQIMEKAGAVMERDAYQKETGFYIVNSLYFDDYSDTCAKENVAGEGIRFKYRIRYYNDNPDLMFLEKKEKKNCYCHKKSLRISKNEYEKLLTGDVEDFLFEEEKPLLKEFAVDILTKAFEPEAIISYRRTAFVEPVSNVRVTFDSGITSSDEFDRFCNCTFEGVPLISDDERILEVKFDYVLPSYIKKAIEAKQINQQSFSKYYIGRNALYEFKKY